MPRKKNMRLKLAESRDHDRKSSRENFEEHLVQTYSDAAVIVVDVAHSAAANAADVPSSDSAVVPAIVSPPHPQPHPPSLLALPHPLPVLHPRSALYADGLAMSLRRLEDGCVMLDPYLPIVSPTHPRGFLCLPPTPTLDSDIPFSDLLCRAFSAPRSSVVCSWYTAPGIIVFLPPFWVVGFTPAFFTTSKPLCRVCVWQSVIRSASVAPRKPLGMGLMKGAWSLAMSWSSKSMVVVAVSFWLCNDREVGGLVKEGARRLRRVWGDLDRFESRHLSLGKHLLAAFGCISFFSRTTLGEANIDACFTSKSYSPPEES
ncbi:hypothetical protein KCU72_g10, partial [Aureobasidium melanogenum]